MSTNNYFSLRSTRRSFTFFNDRDPESERQALSALSAVPCSDITVWNPTALTRVRGIQQIGETRREKLTVREPKVDAYEGSITNKETIQ